MSADVEKPAPYVDLCEPIDTDLLMGLVRFRLGARHFRVSTGRTWDGTARADRLCCKCARHVVEEHVMFDCPYYDGIRVRYANQNLNGRREDHGAGQLRVVSYPPLLPLILTT
jgi:hypothetical protein